MVIIPDTLGSYIKIQTVSGEKTQGKLISIKPAEIELSCCGNLKTISIADIVYIDELQNSCTPLLKTIYCCIVFCCIVIIFVSVYNSFCVISTLPLMLLILFNLLSVVMVDKCDTTIDNDIYPSLFNSILWFQPIVYICFDRTKESYRGNKVYFQALFLVAVMLAIYTSLNINMSEVMSSTYYYIRSSMNNLALSITVMLLIELILNS